jgi:hypothetical protein
LSGSVSDDRWGGEGEGAGGGGAESGDGGDVAGGVELADAAVASVSEGEEAGGRESGGAGRVERGGGGGAVVAGEALGAVTSDGGDDAGGGIDAADAVVGGVGEVEVAGGVDGEALWEREGGADGRVGVAGEPEGASTGDGGDDAGTGGNAADEMVVGVGEVEVVGGIEGKALRRVDGGLDSGAVVAGDSLCAGTGDGGDETSGGGYATNAVVGGVGKVEVADGVESECGGKIELGRGG